MVASTKSFYAYTARLRRCWEALTYLRVLSGKSESGSLIPCMVANGHLRTCVAVLP